MVAKRSGDAKAKAKAAKRESQERKAAKKSAKADGEENVPIVELLKKLDDRSAGLETVARKVSSPPKPRTSFTFLNTKNGFIVFGGEHYDARTCKVFNDCYKWTPEKEEETWKMGAPAKIKPRVGHASCAYNDEVYVLGGEFATASQFYHFRDFWKLDTKTLKWEELSAQGGPSARSGHRLAVSRNSLLVFGGFHDNGREVRYFNDLYAFLPATAHWSKIAIAKAPPVRSAAVVAANNEQLVVSGGFSKVKDTDRDCKGTMHEDIWALDLKPLFEGREQDLVWMRLKKRALIRAGLAYCQHKNLVYAFGGVVDNDAGGNSYNSSFFFADVWQFDLGAKTWQRLKVVAEGGAEDSASQTGVAAPLTAWRPKKTGLERVTLDVDLMKKMVSENEAKRNNEKARDRAAERTKLSDAGVLEKFSGLLRYDADPKTLPAPLPRSNSAVAVKDGYLYMYGGSLELGSSRILLFDDGWKLNLRRLEWECIMPGLYWTTVPQEDGSESDSSSSSEGSSCTDSDDASSGHDLSDSDEDDGIADSSSTISEIE